MQTDLAIVRQPLGNIEPSTGDTEHSGQETWTAGNDHRSASECTSPVHRGRPSSPNGMRASQGTGMFGDSSSSDYAGFEMI